MMNFKTARKRRKNDSGKEALEIEGERSWGNEGKRERGRERGNTEGVEGGSYVCN